MNNIEKKHLEHLHEIESVEAAMKWYGWGSPIGLSIFLLSLVGIAVIIKIVFLG
jgi:hypothetical protein